MMRPPAFDDISPLRQITPSVTASAPYLFRPPAAWRFRWNKNTDTPLPPDELVRSSANMHMIPADKAVASALHAVEPGQRVRIDGWLVEVNAGEGWRWRSSLTREDSGGGACELVFVCAVSTL